MSLVSEIRAEVAERQRHRQSWRKHDAAADELRHELTKERELRDRLVHNATVLHKEIRREAERDEEGEGRHTEEWEERVADRIDVIADEVETCEFEIDAMFEKAQNHRDLKNDLRKELNADERRIERLRKRREERAQSSGDLTKDFNVAEFHCRNGVHVPDGIVPHLVALCRNHLQPLRDSGGTVAINSGYRTAAYNASIGGATQSYHIYDLRMKAPAADHIQSGRSASAVQAWHEGHNPFDGMGFYPGFTHGDDRGYHSRWYGAA